MAHKPFYGTFYGGATSEMLLLVSKRHTKLILLEVRGGKFEETL